MAGRHNWDKLIGRMTPERRTRIEQGVRENLTEMLLSEIRRVAGLTQEQVAETLGIKQPTLSQLESQNDMQITTLRRIIEALGGELEIIARFPGARIKLSQFKEHETKLRTA
ncbi:MAG TPA: helix-turn-helix transcriptional regulator [Tepidisphaeraceae bacterium]|jgi:transcriptional regulator with XRE-family HTH domain|nr:helix-turn-helix transcriptional regulator [Tepidisphaeraceae bacterium]